jgi:hypothetical protein
MEIRGVFLPNVGPGLAPGGLWLRLCTEDRIVFERAILETDPAAAFAAADAELTSEQVRPGERAWLYFYDGDSGECMGTLIMRRGEK